ncbi:MAG: hypothetical protein BJ554DRAFT_4865, partial [Olpidium bornovanus]
PLRRQLRLRVDAPFARQSVFGGVQDVETARLRAEKQDRRAGSRLVRRRAPRRARETGKRPGLQARRGKHRPETPAAAAAQTVTGAGLLRGASRVRPGSAAQPGIVPVRFQVDEPAAQAAVRRLAAGARMLLAAEDGNERTLPAEGGREMGVLKVFVCLLFDGGRPPPRVGGRSLE